MGIVYSHTCVRLGISIFSPVVVEKYFLARHFKMAWETYLKSLGESSRPKYERWIQLFQEHQDSYDDQSTFESRIINFFENLHNEGYAAKTIWSIYSIVKSYLQTTKSFHIEDQIPQLTRLIINWGKKEEVKKSKTFSQDEVKRFTTDAPDDYIYLPMKVALIIGLHGVLRVSELVDLDFNNIQVRYDIQAIQGSVTRKKQKGPRANSTFLITDDLFRSKVQLYIQKFVDAVRSFSCSIKKMNVFHCCIQLENFSHSLSRKKIKGVSCADLPKLERLLIKKLVK